MSSFAHPLSVLPPRTDSAVFPLNTDLVGGIFNLPEVRGGGTRRQRRR
jgi:hypothetical protein